MAEINPGIALAVNPPGGGGQGGGIQYPDFSRTLSSLAQMQLAGAHAGLYSLEAAKQAMTIQGLQAAQQQLSAGKSPEEAVAPLMALDPNVGQTWLSGQKQMQVLGVLHAHGAGAAGGNQSDVAAIAAAGDTESATKLATSSGLQSYNTEQGEIRAKAGLPPAVVPTASQAAPRQQYTSEQLLGIVDGTARQYGIDPTHFRALADQESGGNPYAVSQTGARGLFQFTGSTAQRYGLANPFDPAANADAAAKLWVDNAASLKAALGRDPTPAEVMLAHNQGAGGAANLLANPQARAIDVVGRVAVMANGGTPNMTAGQFANMKMNQYGNAAARMGPVAGPAAANGPAPTSPPVGGPATPAENDVDIREKGQGGYEAIQRLNVLKEKVQQAPEKAFGPVEGSEYGQKVNAVVGSTLPQIGEQSTSNPNSYRNVATAQSELQGLYSDVGSSMLKARYGARITNLDVSQGMKIVGGLASVNKDAALKTIDNNVREANMAIWNAVNRGVFDTRQLPHPKTEQDMKALGPGAVYVAPDGTPRRAPLY